VHLNPGVFTTAGTTYYLNTFRTPVAGLSNPNNIDPVVSVGTTSSQYVLTSSCYSTDSIWVKRNCYLNIPNSFSPNGDGLNDYFLPRELLASGLTTFTMNIYKRWGENIFSTTSIDGRGWDGNTMASISL